MTRNTVKKQKTGGWILSGLVIFFMLFDATIKFIKPIEVIEITVNELGYGEHHIFVMGVLALIVTLLYAFPKSSILGAILLTGYLGGAIATHLRVDNPLLSHQLFPAYLAILAWSGLWLRNEKLRKVIPFNTSE